MKRDKSKAGVEQNSVLQEFIQKVQQRMEEIQQMEEEKTEKEEDLESDKIDLESNNTVQNFKQFLPDQDQLNPQNLPKDLSLGLDGGDNINT